MPAIQPSMILERPQTGRGGAPGKPSTPPSLAGVSGGRRVAEWSNAEWLNG